MWFRAVLVLLLVAVAALFGAVGFGPRWSLRRTWAAIEPQLRARGIHVAIGEVGHSLPRGAILRDVVLYRDAAHSRPIVRFDEVAVAIGHGGHGWRPTAVITLNGTTGTIHSPTREYRLSGLSGSAVVGVRGIDIGSLAGRYEGLGVQFGGWVGFAPSDAQPETRATASAPIPGASTGPLDNVDLAPLDAFFRWADFRHPDEGHAGDSMLSVDLDSPEPGVADVAGRLQGERFVWRGAPVERLTALFDVRRRPDAEAVIGVDLYQFGYRGGEGAGRCEVDFGAGAGGQVRILEWQGGIDVPRLLAETALVESPMPVVIDGKAPRIRASGVIPFADPARGRLSLEWVGPPDAALTWAGVGGSAGRVTGLEGKVEVADGRVRTDGLRLEWAGGEGRLEADVAIDGETSGEGAGTIVYRRGDGELTAAFRLAGEGSRMEIDRFVSTIEPTGLLREIRPESALSGLTVERAPRIEGSASVDLRAPGGSRAKLAVSGPGLVTVTAGKAPFHLTDPAGELVLERGVVSTANLSAGAFGGRVWMGGWMTVAGPARPFGASFELSDARLVEINPVLGRTGDSRGAIHFTFYGGGEATLDGAWGGGSLRADGAHFEGFPLFAALGGLFSLVSPSFGEDARSALTLDYGLAHGVLNAERCLLNVALFTVETRGWVDLMQRQLEIRGKVRTRGLTGIATAVIGQLLEIEAKGSWDDWRWRFGNVPGSEGPEELEALKGRVTAAKEAAARAEAAAAASASPPKRKGFLGRVGDSLTGGRRRQAAPPPVAPGTNPPIPE